MKKLWLIVMAVLLLAGCGGPETFETMSDVYLEPTGLQPRKTMLTLPENASVTTMEVSSAGSMYLCDNYCVAVQTLEAGDLDATLRQITGFSRDKLLVMSLDQAQGMRYECVWAAAGEGGDQVGRAVILDDGDFHYTLTVMAAADAAGTLAETWQGILDSFCFGEAA